MALIVRVIGGRLVTHRILRAGAAAVLGVTLAAAQDPSTGGSEGQASKDSKESKRILWIIPNYKTFPTLTNYQPLTASEKFKLATEDSFDRGTVVLAALFAGEAQLTNANRSFGQGVAGYGRYFGASYGDLLIGNYMTEAIFPTILHQDPRYFRRGTGSGLSRLGYAMSRIFVTQRDSGGTQFNFSEIAGNTAAVAISNSYYANNRTAHDAVSKLGMQIGVDMTGNILKEFWPDLKRKLGGKHRHETESFR